MVYENANDPWVVAASHWNIKNVIPCGAPSVVKYLNRAGVTHYAGSGELIVPEHSVPVYGLISHAWRWSLQDQRFDDCGACAAGWLAAAGRYAFDYGDPTAELPDPHWSNDDKAKFFAEVAARHYDEWT